MSLDKVVTATMMQCLWKKEMLFCIASKCKRHQILAWSSLIAGKSKQNLVPIKGRIHSYQIPWKGSFHLTLHSLKVLWNHLIQKQHWFPVKTFSCEGGSGHEVTLFYVLYRIQGRPVTYIMAFIPASILLKLIQRQKQSCSNQFWILPMQILWIQVSMLGWWFDRAETKWDALPITLPTQLEIISHNN